jgi:hypothetical protein
VLTYSNADTSHIIQQRNNTMYSDSDSNTKFELKQFEVMSDILKQLKFVFFYGF